MSSSQLSLSFPSSNRQFLDAYLPRRSSASSPYPFTTLTFATSLDSALSLSPSTPTPLSSSATKALTHYLRSVHCAILIGVGTAIADNPSLNCRLEGVGGYGGDELKGQPRPVVVDPDLRWRFEGSKLLELVGEGRGKAPWIITSIPSYKIPVERQEVLRLVGGKFIVVPKHSLSTRIDWRDILGAVKSNGIESIMIEGGGSVINSLLQPEYFEIIDSVIVTIAPVWLGQGGVVVSPPRSDERKVAVRLNNVAWKQLEEDVVMCGKITAE